MSLIDDDGVIAAEQWVALNLGEQNTIRHNHQTGGGRGFIRKAHLIADVIAQSGLSFLAEAFGYCACCNTARLGVCNAVAMAASPHFEQHFRDLGCFTRAGLALDYHDLGALNGCDDVVFGRANRQLCGVREFHNRHSNKTVYSTGPPGEIAH